MSAECGLLGWELTELRDLEKALQKKFGWDASYSSCRLGGELMAGFCFISNHSSRTSQGLLSFGFYDDFMSSGISLPSMTFSFQRVTSYVIAV